MRPIDNFYKVLSDNEIDKLHENAVLLLEETGMKIENDAMLHALKNKGSVVDFSNNIVKIPRNFTEEVIKIASAEEKERVNNAAKKSLKYSYNSSVGFQKSGNKNSANSQNSGKDLSNIMETSYEDLLSFSWHTPFRNRTPAIQASFGGGAPLYYDHAIRQNRYARASDVMRMINLAEGLKEVVTVGNAVHYLKEDDGSDVAPKMVAIKGAAMVAMHSSKPGCTSIIDRRQLPFLMEIGRIVKGSAGDYMKNPIFVNIHDTESPLRLTRPEAAIIEDMVKEKISIFILPMPLIGISTPVYPISAAIIGVAEILGVWAAVKALNESNPVEARCVCGVLNPVTGAANFSTPETLLADLAVAQLFRQKYEIPCGTGIGLIDAPYPGALSIYERTFKATVSTLAGEPSFPVGIIGGAVVFSMEQVILDLDIASFQSGIMEGIGGCEFDESLELIKQHGIGGLFIDSAHTAKNFMEFLTFTRAIKSIKNSNVSEAMKSDPVELAYLKCCEILEKTRQYQIENDRAQAISEVVRAAEKKLSDISGAME